MKRRDRARGCLLVAPLVGAALGLVVLAGLTAALASAARWVVRANERTETHDAADAIAQAFLFDLRTTGWDPAGAGVARLAGGGATDLELHRDLDGDGAIDLASAERIRWRLVPATGAVSRLVGNQSMPLTGAAAAAAFTYLDAAGAPIAAPASGLAAADLARVRAVALVLTLAPPGGGAPVQRTVTVAVRGGTG